MVKHWLAGPKAGTTELLIDNLPGMPDGMQRASDGNFWITLVAADKPLPVFLGSSGKFMRWVVGKALQYIKPPLKKFGMVVKVNRARRIPVV